MFSIPATKLLVTALCLEVIREISEVSAIYRAAIYIESYKFSRIFNGWDNFDDAHRRSKVNVSVRT